VRTHFFIYNDFVESSNQFLTASFQLLPADDEAHVHGWGLFKGTILTQVAILNKTSRERCLSNSENLDRAEAVLNEEWADYRQGVAPLYSVVQATHQVGVVATSDALP
jgi:hypothetical protein